MATGEPVSLEYTPTWAVATVCFSIISISVIMENSIHILKRWLKRRHKSVLYDAIARLQSELMLMGVLSLLLASTQRKISKICVSAEVANRMLPCGRDLHTAADYVGGSQEAAMEGNASDPCASKGKVTLITVKGIQQLQQFIFVLAAMQIVHSILTVAFGRLKMKRWKAWERELQNVPKKLDLADKLHLGDDTTRVPKLQLNCGWQFYNSVAKIDYLTLRQGFIMTHLSARQLNHFNFQKYTEHSLDQDFKVVVSISPLMWFTVVVFMLVDIHGWHSYFWLSFAPLLIVLTIGTKLEVIVEKMAVELKKQKKVISGAPVVEPNDNKFWFGKPEFILGLLHLTLFLNAFEMAFFIWVTIEFGSDSCYHERTVTPLRIGLAVAVQVICSYVTLPIYALVTQMGSQFKGEIFKEKVGDVLKQWHGQVRRRRIKALEFTLEKSPPAAAKFTTNQRGLSSFFAETSDKISTN